MGDRQEGESNLAWMCRVSEERWKRMHAEEEASRLRMLERLQPSPKNDEIVVDN